MMDMSKWSAKDMRRIAAIAEYYYGEQTDHLRSALETAAEKVQHLESDFATRKAAVIHELQESLSALDRCQAKSTLPHRAIDCQSTPID